MLKKQDISQNNSIRAKTQTKHTYWLDQKTHFSKDVNDHNAKASHIETKLQQKLKKLATKVITSHRPDASESNSDTKRVFQQYSLTKSDI